MKIRISMPEKEKAKEQCHLFYDADRGHGNTLANPLDPDKATWVNAKVERAAHADRVHRMVVHTFTKFLDMMVIEKSYNTKHSGELV